MSARPSDALRAASQTPRGVSAKHLLGAVAAGILGFGCFCCSGDDAGEAETGPLERGDDWRDVRQPDGTKVTKHRKRSGKHFKNIKSGRDAFLYGDHTSDWVSQIEERARPCTYLLKRGRADLYYSLREDGFEETKRRNPDTVHTPEDLTETKIFSCHFDNGSPGIGWNHLWQFFIYPEDDGEAEPLLAAVELVDGRSDETSAREREEELREWRRDSYDCSVYDEQHDIYRCFQIFSKIRRVGKSVHVTYSTDPTGVLILAERDAVKDPEIASNKPRAFTEAEMKQIRACSPLQPDCPGYIEGLYDKSDPVTVVDR